MIIPGFRFSSKYPSDKVIEVNLQATDQSIMISLPVIPDHLVIMRGCTIHV